MQIGEYSVSVYICDHFRLDGGAMFGAIPKSLWAKRIAPDELNRIPMVTRILVLESPTRKILVDLGCGDKWSAKELQIYGIENCGRLDNVFSGITDIILTHLHFDHVGGISYLAESGEVLLCFPDALYHLPEANLLHARNAGPRERASYMAQNLNPLSQVRHHLITFDEAAKDVEILPGIFGSLSNGHTHGLMCVRIGSDSGAIAYPSDLIPTAHHLPIPYVMGYDLCAETTMSEKQKYLERAASENWIVVFEHDAQTPAGTLTKDCTGKIVMEKVAEIPEFCG